MINKDNTTKNEDISKRTLKFLEPIKNFLLPYEYRLTRNVNTNSVQENRNNDTETENIQECLSQNVNTNTIQENRNNDTTTENIQECESVQCSKFIRVDESTTLNGKTRTY